VGCRAIDFLTLCKKLKSKQCPRWNDRQRRLHALSAVQNYSFYEILEDQFADFEERYKTGRQNDKEYRPLNERRSGVEYRLPMIITRDVVALLFGEGKFPQILFENETDTDAAAEIIKAAHLEVIMNTAATTGAVGSVVIVPEVFDDEDGTNRLYIDIWDSWECDPVFKRSDPDALESITRTRLVKREDLISDGYDVAALEKKWNKKQIEGAQSVTVASALINAPQKYDFWYVRRKIDAKESIWYEPVPRPIYENKEWDAWERDAGRSRTHDLGCCYPLWVRPRSRPGQTDGPCLFDGAITNEFAVERVASVGAQALVTAGQPILATSGTQTSTGLSDASSLEGTDGFPSTSGSSVSVDPESILDVPEKGGAWLVQLDAGSLTPLDIFILRMRALSLENCGGSRITEESLTGAKSGYAMELLNQALTYVAGAQRPSWADTVIKLLDTIALMQLKFNGIDGIEKILKIGAKVKSVSWGPWYEPTGDDLLSLVMAAAKAHEAGAIDDETLVASIAPLFDVVNIDDMVKKVKAQVKERAETEHKQQLELKTAAPPQAAA
jgi:hypothetical protein